MPSANLFDNLPDKPTTEEIVEQLLAISNVRIERIVSTGQASAPGFWYDQAQAEWVLLIQGSAEIRFEDESTVRALKAGDFLYISPHRCHRVVFTQTEPQTVWLAIHIESDHRSSLPAVSN